jgi:hypothetical protein
MLYSIVDCKRCTHQVLLPSGLRMRALKFRLFHSICVSFIYFKFFIAHAKRYIDSLGVLNYDFSLFNPQQIQQMEEAKKEKINGGT